jgi:uncharacterized protein
MRSLTKTWSSFKYVDCKLENCSITHRLFFQKLEDPLHREAPLYLAVNSLSGAIDVFSRHNGEALERFINCGDKSEISEKLFIFLCKRGYVFPSKEIEEIIFNTIIVHYKNKMYFDSKILGYFAIDMSCPMKCEYCFEKKYEQQGDAFEKAIMDKESIRAAFNFLDLIKDLQCRDIDFVAGWGGEPLQEKNVDANREFIKSAKQRGFNIAYFSNLAFIGDETVRLLSENADHFKFIQTTLDNIPSEHNKQRKIQNAFEKTVESVNRLLKLDLPIIVRTNIGAHNIEALPKLAEFYHEQGWFKFPKFKGFITHVYDRHHEFTKKFTDTEDNILSRFLELRDEHRLVRKIQGIKFAPSINNILKAFELRETNDITRENFGVHITPIITYCYASNRAEYVFTGAPNYSIYNCAECTGLSRFKIGRYYPEVSVDKNGAHIWNMRDGLHSVRSIDTLSKCKVCAAATFCGGYCALESICDYNNTNTGEVFCKKADEIIRNFLRNESSRLYKRIKVLLEKTENITI